MGYDVHITRRQNWFDKEGPDISLAEWLAIIATDPEMRDGSVLRTDDEGIAAWITYSQHGVGGNMGWFYYWRGQVVVKNPDEEMRRKLWQLAQRLGAQVQGDEGEIYGTDGTVQRYSSTQDDKGKKAKPWWKLW